MQDWSLGKFAIPWRMYYLSTISSFCCTQDRHLHRRILYDLIKRAPCRQSISWCIAPCFSEQQSGHHAFGTIRSTLVDKLPGRVSQLMNMILHVFWPEHGPSMERGVTIVTKHEMPRIIAAPKTGQNQHWPPLLRSSSRRNQARYA